MRWWCDFDGKRGGRKTCLAAHVHMLMHVRAYDVFVHFLPEDSYRHGMLRYQEILTQGRLFTHLNEIPHFSWYYGKVEKYYYRPK